MDLNRHLQLTFEFTGSICEDVRLLPFNHLWGKRTMHHCLRVLDIIRSIFQFVYDDSGDGLKDVATLATTCRIFKDPALDVLWRTMPTLAPLIMCLPDDAWEILVDDHRPVLSLKRATTDTDWARSKLYASRIRRLGYPVEDRSTRVIYVNSSVLEIMSISRAVSFPNLQELSWNQGNLPLLGLFLGPHLVEFNIAFPQDPHYLVPTLLDSLRTICPSLRNLQITAANGPRPVLSSIFPKLVGGLNHLEHLSCNMFTLPDEALHVLAASSTLRILNINNTVEDLLRTLSPDEPSFTQMKRITIRALSMQSCCDLFSRIDMRYMQAIVVGHTNQHTPVAADIQEFFATLENRCSHTLLTTILIRQDPNVRSIPGNLVWQSPDYTISPVAIKPLLPFKNLESLELSFECPYNFDNTAMVIMTAAWPLMRRFCLGSNVGWGEVSRVTLDGLIPVAKSWPRLESLSLCINPVTNQIDGRRPGGGHSCPHLTLMGFATSVIDTHPALVAAFLTDLFPNLRSILVTEFLDEWHEVELLLPVFADVRKQERAWKEGI